MTVTAALQLRFGNHCGLFWVVKRFFQQCTILKRTVKLNVNNGLLNKLYVRIDNWVNALPLTELTINNSISDSTGCSPFHIVYGKNVKMPVDYLDGMHSNAAAQDLVTYMS